LGVLAASACPNALHIRLALWPACPASALGGKDEDEDAKGEEGASHDGNQDEISC